MTLGQAIEELRKNDYVPYGSILRFLTELRDRRESALRLATAFTKVMPDNQMEHIYSELAEVDNELWLYKQNGKTDRLAEELVDLQMSCETMLPILGLDEQQRTTAMMDGNTTLADLIKQDKADLKAEYETKRQAITNG